MHNQLNIAPVLHRFQIKPFDKVYAGQVSVLFHCAVHAIDGRHYSSAQLNAWSSQPRSAKYWELRLTRTQAWVMLDFNPSKPLASPFCCGFINLETEYFQRGYIDSLYIHPDYQGQGFARQLLWHAKQWAKSRKYPELRVDASYYSRPLFEQEGFELLYKSYQPKSGQMLPGFHMRLSLL
ncbi:MAG: GNAT family N-acetyltransferase [Shewanella sp.]|nr:GNAT family N-acetyltransferase [Shewanella sp.]MCF1431801.1 GNAT family N-acetyltransferase [Shewanella sp.]MCF1438384.1 GNAT family N-acetyltransferase [Shewanella sp.]MCF1456835.1 GNAT family N-acetyltransferase [Shewanella sp.]